MIKLEITLAGKSKAGNHWIRVTRMTTVKVANGTINVKENAFLTTEKLVDITKAKHVELPTAFVNQLNWS